MDPHFSESIQNANRTPAMNVLMICNKSPWPLKEGGPIAMHMIIGGLLSAGHRVKVLAVNSYKYKVDARSIPEDFRQQTGIELVDVDLRVRPLAAFLNLFTGRSYHVERFDTAGFRKKLTGILQSEHFDIVQLETLYVCPYISTIRKFSGAKIILRAHNIEHLIWQRLAEETRNPLKKFYIRHLSSTLKKYEHKVIHSVDGIAAITWKDADYFSGVLTTHGSLTERIPVIDIPFGLDIKLYPAPAEEPESASLFTIGSMNWMPNEEGVKWFLEKVWPDLHRQFPQLKYYLAGRAMPEWMQQLRLPNVEVLGEVEDAHQFIRSHSVMIVPLFSGSGIRIKIIEGMASGKAIISTSLGAEGISYINGENILIANAPCEFFDMVSICIEDPSRRRKIGQNARQLIETGYDRDAITLRLISFYQQLMD
jgi:polysaccharide biosynthesis protein PslH